jgi:ribosomal protein S18 acetylase RimI-like enzyme
VQYSIRDLDVSDYEQLIDLWRRSGLDHRPKGRDNLKSMRPEFEREETCILGMFDGDRLIGSVIGSSDGRKGWINRLAVDPRYRGMELSQALIAECEKFLHLLGLKVIAALIEGENPASRKAFVKADYVYANKVSYYSKRTSEDD